jgi:anion-transporting  ArsA/GET3 family ATPase
MLMSPRATFKKILKEDIESNIIKNLARPHGGMNEIMSIIEVQFQLKKNIYDVIVLDTPPGKHFLDFLESSEKIKNFFDKTFVDIFNFYIKKSNNIFGKILDTGIKKLLSYLENVTGADFVTEFINTVYALYQSREIFLAALNFQEDLKREDYSNWFLVTSVEQEKVNEAEEIKEKARHFMHQDHFLIINKSVASYLKSWNPKADSKLFELKDSLLKRELDLATYAGKNYKKIIKFSEVNHPSPMEHVKELARQFSGI